MTARDERAVSTLGLADPASIPPVLRRIVGQPRAVTVLAGARLAPVHAFLFVGPPGTGKREAALDFAASLLVARGGCGDCPVCRDVRSLRHPDVTVAERRGAALSVDEARAIGAMAQRSPRLGSRQILILADLHLVGRAAPVLLKTIEEPPETTIFVVLADALSPMLATIASRCLQVEFKPLSLTDLEAALVAEGVTPATAASAAAGAAGRLDRARLLAADPGFVQRQAHWRSVPERLDGTGATVVLLAGELLEGADGLVEVLRERQQGELEAARAAAERAGDRHIPGRQEIEDRHKREQRRVRTDEFRAGLASLVEAYRSRLNSPDLPTRRLKTLARACEAIDSATKGLERNPNEALLLQSLLVDLDREG